MSNLGIRLSGFLDAAIRPDFHESSIRDSLGDSARSSARPGATAAFRQVLGLSLAAGPCDRAAECLDDLVAAVAAPELLVPAMRKRLGAGTRPTTGCLVHPALPAVLEGLRTAGLADWWAPAQSPVQGAKA